MSPDWYAHQLCRRVSASAVLIGCADGIQPKSMPILSAMITMLHTIISKTALPRCTASKHLAVTASGSLVFGLIECAGPIAHQPAIFAVRIHTEEALTLKLESADSQAHL